MRKKIKYLIIALFVVFIAYELYYHITRDGNSLIYISGQSETLKGDAILYINNTKIDTINLDEHYSYFKGHNLSFGKNKLSIK